MADRLKIVILGAGMSGIACALNLYNKFDVSIYEKSRGVVEGFAQNHYPMDCFTLEHNFVRRKQALLRHF